MSTVLKRKAVGEQNVAARECDRCQKQTRMEANRNGSTTDNGFRR